MTADKPLTAESLLELLRSAVLDPARAKMLSPEGKQELVVLVSLEMLERDLPAIEAAAYAEGLAAGRQQGWRVREALADVLAYNRPDDYKPDLVKARRVLDAALAAGDGESNA